MKYIVSADFRQAHEFETASEAAYYITENLGEEPFDEMLDECYEPVKILGYDYSPSLALYRVDEIAYRCAMNDYYDSLSQDIEYDIDRMDDGETETFYGFEVEAVEDEEAEEE